jgi:Methyltransferase domain
VGRRPSVLAFNSMSMIREIVNAAIWQGDDPFSTFAERLNDPTESDHVLMRDRLDSFVIDVDAGQLPRVVIVAGADHGTTTLRIARLFRERRHDGVIIAVDTWLGSWEDWCERDAPKRLRLTAAGLTPHETFMARVRAEEIHPYVVPLPLDDPNACTLLKRKQLSADLLYLELRVGRMAAEDQLKLWWPLLRDGGRLIVDIERRHQHSFLQAKQTTEIFAAGHGATFASVETIIRIDKGLAGSLASHQQPHVWRDVPAAPLTLDYEGEFGAELVLFLPYVTWLSRAGLLRQTRVVIYAGMRCFYDHLQCAELVEKHSLRQHIRVDQRLPALPVKSELLYDVADLSPFHVFPDLRKKFRQLPLAYGFERAKPLLIVHNKYAIEWNRQPINHLDLDVLDRLFRELAPQFTIVYIRHGMTPAPVGYSQDDNFTLPFDDRSVLDAHPDVMSFDDVYTAYSTKCGDQDVNTFKNVLYSRCHYFISSQGGGAAHMSFFSGSLLMVLHRYGREERLAYGNGPYGFVANPAPIRVICLNNDELLRGLGLFQGSSVIDGRVMITSDLQSLLHELSPWTLEKRRNGKWSR